jgi:uncharacterized protein (TIGR03382 family)
MVTVRHVVRTVLAAALLVAGAGPAAANGRDPFMSTINFKAGDDSKIMAGATFGLIRSDDGGATWQWYCERTVGYGGQYDPDYVYSPTGAVFATTFDGLKVMRDGCSFAATPPGMTFVTRVERGGNNAIYFTASDPNDTKIYKSTDDGVTFPTSVTIPGTADAWWQSIMVAPSHVTAANAQVVYLSGYRLPKACDQSSSNAGTTCTTNADCTESAPDAGACETKPKVFLLYKSVDSGASFTAMATTGITPTSQNSTIDIVGVDPKDPTIVYARVTLESATSGDSIYKSTNGGTSWTKILSKSPNIGGLVFLVRRDGSCVAGTRDIGAWTSPYVNNQGCGATWADLTAAPHIGCLAENAAGVVWACTQNTESVQLGLTSDGYGIMKSSDLATWTGVLRFEDIQAPVACPAGTIQQDRCVGRYMEEQSAWCCLTAQLGITSTAVDCTGYMACFGTRDEAAPDGRQKQPPPGCWGCGAGSKPPVLLTLLVAAGLLFRRRKPKET